MKNLFSKFLFGLLSIVTQLAFAQSITEKYHVEGECGMCKTRIEKTSIAQGVSSANWDEQTKVLTVEYDTQKTSKTKILQAIADVGHDNELFKAKDEVYQKLPACCLYERPKAQSSKQANEYYVKGNCGMCKTRIEKAAKDAGATSATWDAEKQTVVLDFDFTKTNADIILKKIADVGHDNERYQAQNTVYEKLPACCLYDRELPLGAKSDLVHSETPSQQNSADEKNHNHSTNEKTTTIDGVTVTKMKDATALNRKEASLTFNINGKELLKAACCNLSESFETNATVDVSYANAVTGTKQLKMLGLDQKYTSLTKELFPEIRGISSAYGLNFIPGRWIGGIQLTKGGSTVTNGYESITGQINTELLKYQDKNETTFNVFADQNARLETNITQVSALNEHWNQSILIHGNGTFTKSDYNKDGFLDQPTGNQVNIAYLLNYNDLNHSGWGSHFGINFLKDTRDAGQMSFDKSKAQSEQSAYGVGIDIGRIQMWNKTGYIFKDQPYRSLGWMNQYTYHQQNSFFGLRNYDGKQNTFYSNFIYEDIFGTTNHKYKVGASFLYDTYKEDYLSTRFEREETVPGLFAEYTLTGSKYTLVAGARVDFHNLAGTQFSPRLNFKYDIAPETILRLSAGKGFRTANIFAENQQYFASNREIEIISNNGKIYSLQPEIAWNYGVSLQQEFRLFGNKSSIIADFFRTAFENQVVVDMDQSAQKLLFYNLNGSSFANSFQTQWDFSPIKNLDFRIAYKYYDVQADYLDGRKQIPFMAKHRGFANIAYATNKSEKGGFWSFDSTLNIVGKQRLPNTKNNPSEFQLPEFSTTFSTLNAQISKHFNDKIRLYVGGENLTSTEQDQPIIDAKNPFGNYFDAGMIYAPIMPANFYVGLDVKF